jgi:hypothetical protein
MTRLAQMTHIAAKDFRELKWLNAMYAVVVALAAGQGTRVGMTLELWQLPLVVLFGMALVATAVQSDSPTRTDSPWAGRPLYPSAVVGAKALFAIAYVILLPLVAEIVALHTHGVIAANIPEIAAGSAATYALLLLAAALGGAATRNFRTCVLVLLIVAIVALLVFSSLGDLAPSFAVAAAIPTIVAAGGIALFMFLYRTRDARRLTLGAVLACCGLLIGAAAPPYTVRPPIDSPKTVVTISAMRDDSSPINTLSHFRVMLNLDTLDIHRAERLLLVRPVAHLALDDGREVPVPIIGDVDLHVPAPDTLKGVHWTVYPSSWDTHHIPVEVSLRPADQAQVGRHRVVRVTIDGTTTTWRAHIAASGPIHVDSPFVAGGRRYNVVRWTHAAGEAALDVSESWVSQDLSGAPRASLASTLSRTDVGGPQIAFYNDRAPVVNGMMQSHSTQASGSNLMILPGVTVNDLLTTYETGRGGPSSPVADDAWFAGLHIAIIEWTLTGSFPTRIDVTMP